MTESGDKKIYPCTTNETISTSKTYLTGVKFGKEYEQHENNATDPKIQRRRISMSGKLSKITKRQYYLSKYRSDGKSNTIKGKESISSLPDEERGDHAKGFFTANRLSIELSDLVDQLCTGECIYPPLSILLKILFERGPSTIGIFRKSSNCRQVDSILSGLIALVQSEVGKSSIDVPLDKQSSSMSMDEFNKIRDPHLAAAIFKRLLQASSRPFFSTVVCTKWIEACGCVLPDHIAACGVVHEEREQQTTKYKRTSKALFLINRNSVISTAANSNSSSAVKSVTAGVTNSVTEATSCFREQAIADVWSKRCTMSAAMYTMAKDAIEQLSPGRFLLFRFLVNILYVIQSCQSQNNMDFDALAICTSNVLFEQNCKVISLSNACILSQAASSFVSFVLRNCVDLFGKRITSCFVDEKFRLRREQAGLVFPPHFEKTQSSDEKAFQDNCINPRNDKDVTRVADSYCLGKFNTNKSASRLPTCVDISSRSPSTSQSRRTFDLNREVWEAKCISDQHRQSKCPGQSIDNVEHNLVLPIESTYQNENDKPHDNTERLPYFLNTQSGTRDSADDRESILLSSKISETKNSVDLRPRGSRKGFTGWLKSVYLRSNLINVRNNDANKYFMYPRRQSCKSRLHEEEKFQATVYIGGTTLDQNNLPSAKFNELKISKSETRVETRWQLVEQRSLNSSVNKDHDSKLHIKNPTSPCGYSLMNCQVPGSLIKQYDKMIPTTLAKHYNNQKVLSPDSILTEYITSNSQKTSSSSSSRKERDAYPTTIKQKEASNVQLRRRFSTPSKIIIKEDNVLATRNNFSSGGECTSGNSECTKPVIPSYVYRHFLKTANSALHTSIKINDIGYGDFASDWLRAHNNNNNSMVTSNNMRPLHSTPVNKLIQAYDENRASRFLKQLENKDVGHISSNVFRLKAQCDNMLEPVSNTNLSVNTLHTIYVNL